MATTKATLDIPAPRPWRIEGQAIWDADGVCIVSAFNPASMATRRLIVEAVNAHGAAPGDAAALRAALVAIRDAARNFYQQLLNSKYNDIMDEYKCRERGLPALLELRYAIPEANHALASPARNCDRYATWKDAWDAFAAAYFGPTDPGEMEYYFGVWLFAPAEGKEVSNGKQY